MDLFLTRIATYVRKIGGGDATGKPPRAEAHETAKSLVGSFLGIFTMALIDEYWLTAQYEHSFILIGSFGAAAVLMFDAHQSPLAQPWNVVGGQVVSAFVGVSVRKFCTEIVSIGPVVQKALAVSFAIATMDIFDCLHPPGGATSLIAIIGGPGVSKMGYMYVLYAGAGAAIMLSVALLFNNLWNSRSYPKYYWSILNDPAVCELFCYLRSLSLGDVDRLNDTHPSGGAVIDRPDRDVELAVPTESTASVNV
jgi:CBS-domain-containing membrane protein